MNIGIPKERKTGEYRVAITPLSVKRLVENNILVKVEQDAGLGCGYSNEDYEKSGAKIVSQEEVWESNIILKVKEPQQSEYKFFKKGQIIWGYLHLPANLECIHKMQELGVTAIASETILIDGKLELLKPVSEIAGRRSFFVGMHYLEKQYGGKGILLPGIPSQESGTVSIIGGGVVGTNALDMALGIGINVNLLEINEGLIEKLKEKYIGKKVNFVKSTEDNLIKAFKESDIVISTILIRGAKPPKIITKEMVNVMEKGSVIVDVSIDQGGTCQTLNGPTSHENPIEIVDGILHYAVPNMPGAVPKTACEAIQGVIDLILELDKVGLGNINTIDSINSGIQIQGYEIKNDKLKELISLK